MKPLEESTRRWIQVFLAATLLITTVRLLWIVYQRRQPFPQPRRTQTARVPVNPDYYVQPPRAYLTDLKSAQRFKGSTVWVRDGYRYAHFPFDARTRRSREIPDPPLLPPLLRITIAGVSATRARAAVDHLWSGRQRPPHRSSEIAGPIFHSHHRNLAP